MGFSRLEGTHSLTEACGYSGRGKPALSLLRRVDRGAFLSQNDFFSPEVCVCACACACWLNKADQILSPLTVSCALPTTIQSQQLFLPLFLSFCMFVYKHQHSISKAKEGMERA